MRTLNGLAARFPCGKPETVSFLLACMVLIETCSDVCKLDLISPSGEWRTRLTYVEYKEFYMFRTATLKLIADTWKQQQQRSSTPVSE